VRPTEVDTLLGDFSKAKKILGWKPKVNFKQLVRIMIKADLELAKREAHMNNYNGQAEVKVEEGNGEHKGQVKVEVKVKVKEDTEEQDKIQQVLS
jgi:hypothetical protein